MTITLAQLLDDYVYETLQDKDNKVRWTRDELTEYVNVAIRTAIARRPEAGVVTDTSLPLAAGARQTLPADWARLQRVVCNVERVIPTPVVESAVIDGTGTTLTITFNTGVQ